MDELLNRVVIHITKLLRDDIVPNLDEELAKIDGLSEIHDELKTIRDILSAFSATNDHKIHCLIERLRHGMETQNSAIRELKESESRYKYLASHDQLTGAMNRQSFIDRAIVEVGNAIRMQLPCGIIMIDIDHFKKFNDTYGHLAGDMALRHTVHVISSFSRKHDFLGRYGGEEFVFFFGNADSKIAFIMAERIREAIQNNPVILDIGSVPITASFGLAMCDINDFSPDCDTNAYIEKIIKNADIAMYKAKNTGRNRVILYES